MTTTTFALPSSIEISSRGRTVLLAPESLPQEVLAQALEHGLRQKIADSAASALLDAFSAVHDEEAVKASTSDSRKAWGNEHPDAVSDAAQAAMESAITNLREHGWTVRTGGVTPSMTREESVACDLVRQKIKLAGGADWRAIKDLKKAEQASILLDVVNGDRDSWLDAARDEIAHQERLQKNGPKIKLNLPKK